MEGRPFLGETFSLEESHCRGILIRRRDPPVANEQTLQRPLAASIRCDRLVALLDGLCDVRNILTGV